MAARLLTGDIGIGRVIELWSVADGSRLAHLKTAGDIYSAVFSSDGTRGMISSGLWIHFCTFGSDTIVAETNWLMPVYSRGKPLVDREARSARIVTEIVHGKLIILSREADFQAVQLPADSSEELLSKWQRRLGLQFTAEGKIVPAAR